MLIVCPNCATSYQVASSSLGATGRSVRCVRCRNVWFAANTAAMADIALSHHQDGGALSDAAPDQPYAATGGLSEAQDAVPAADIRPDDLPTPDLPTPDLPTPDLAWDDRGPAPPREPPGDDHLLRAPSAEDAPPLAPGNPDRVSQIAAEIMRGDIETVAARRSRRPPMPQRERRSPIWAAAILLLIAANLGLIVGRTEIVRLAPQTAAVYAALGLDVNLRGLAFTDVITRKETIDGVPMLVIEGTIKSTGRRDTEVPRLRFAVQNAQGHEIYSWTAQPEHKVIAPGSSMPFRSRLAAPPPEAHAVLVRFFHRRDLVAGLQ